MEYIIRKRKKEDCKAVHHVTVKAWNETYKGIVNDTFLNNLIINEETVAKKIEEEFDSSSNNVFVLEVDNKIVGFTAYSLISEIKNCGELNALYILKDYKGKGFGKMLVNRVFCEFKNNGINKAIIGCLKDNPSNSFYTTIGGTKLKERVFEKLNLLENVYYFDL